MPKTKFKSKLEDLFGERCPDYEPGCPVCDAWHMYDHHRWGDLLKLIVDIESDMAESDEHCRQINIAIDKRIEQILADAKAVSASLGPVLSAEEVYRQLMKDADGKPEK
jgi:hypothetical protein